MVKKTIVTKPLTVKQKRAIQDAPRGEKEKVKDGFVAQNAEATVKAMRATALAKKPASSVSSAYFSRSDAQTRQADIEDYGSWERATRAAWRLDPATSNLLAPRGLGYYDAFNNDATGAITHLSIGPATPITCTTIIGGTESINTGGTNAQLLLVQPSPGPTQAVLLQVSSGVSTAAIITRSYNSPQLNLDPPEEIMPTRCSLRLTNLTEARRKGGLIYVLRMTTGVRLDPNYTTNADLLALMDGIRTHGRASAIEGGQLTGTLQKNCTVADQPRATTFMPFNLIESSDTVPWLWPNTSNPPVAPTPATDVYPFTKSLHTPAFTPIAILFEAYNSPGETQDIGNEYQVSIRSQFLAHYVQGSILANLALTPKSSVTAMEKHRNKEEATGSAMQHALDGATEVGKWMYKNRGALGTAIASLA